VHREPAGAAALAAALRLGVELADSAAGLHDYLRTNRAAIAALGSEAPPLWSALRDHTRARRSALGGVNPPGT